MAAGGQNPKSTKFAPHKSHFGSAFGPRSSDFNKTWHERTSWPYKQTSFCKIFSVCTKSKMAAGCQMSKINQIWPQKSHFGSSFGTHSSDLNKIWHEHISWYYKQLCAWVFQLVQNPRWPLEVKRPKSTKFGWTGSKCHAEMWFVESNIVDFGPLISGGHLGFCPNW